MTCAHVITDGHLTCQRTDTHDSSAAGGHIYHASECPDVHTQEVLDD